MGIDTVWPTRWINPDIQATVWARESLSLGPEPYIGPQKLILKLHDQQIFISTDGFSSFKVEHES
jgi:general secretion pathway protein H